MTTGQPSWEIWGNLSATGVNWYEVAIDPPPGDLSFVYSSTVSQEDLYNFPALSTTPAAIYTCCVKGNIRDTASGARTISLHMKSSSVDSTGSNAGQSPATTYTWLDSFFDTDPNTTCGMDARGAQQRHLGGRHSLLTPRV